MQTFTGIPARTLLVATAAGAMIGVSYAMSPMTVWFALACVGLAAWAGRGLPPRERRWVLGTLGVAIILRVVPVLALFLLRGPRDQYSVSFFFDGDGAGNILRSVWISTFWSRGHMDWFKAFGAFDRSYGWTSYLLIIAYLDYLFGPAPYAIHLLNIALFAAGGVLIHRFVRLAYGRLAALVGLVLLLFSPTLFLWSIAALKESFVFFLMAVTIITGLHANRARSWRRRLVAATACVLAAAALNTARPGVLAMATGAICLGALAAVAVRRRYVPIVGAILLLVGGSYLLHRNDVYTKVIVQLEQAAARHIGNVRTEGHGYKTLDAHFYAEVNHPLTGPEAFRFVARSVAAFVLLPLPTSARSASEIVFLPAQIIWYATFLLALAGLMPGLRRHALLTLTLAAYGIIGAFIVGLNNGNLGTLVRFRDLVTPFVVWLASLGAVSIFTRMTAGKVGHRERIDRPAPALAVLIGSSVAFRWFQRMTAESQAYRPLHVLFTRPTMYIDGGISQDEERLALEHVDALTERSRIFTIPAAWLARFLAAWPEAAVTRFVMRHVDPLSTPQRVRLVGWMIAVAVAIEALIGGAVPGRVLPFGRGAQLTFLALACLFMIASEKVTAAWNHHYQWNPTSS